MKNISLITLVAFSLVACTTSSLDEKKAELKKAKEEMATLKALVDTLEAQVAALDTTTEAEELGSPVLVEKLEKGPFAHTLHVHGVVEASKNIIANPEVAGRITSIQVREGQRISKGDVIATIDASIMHNNINEVKKGLEFANTIFEKQKALNEKGVGTEVQFLEAKNRKESLEKTLETLNAQLAKYVVTAPISGYVDEIMPKAGEMANPQMGIARLVNLEKVFVEADVSEALLGKINEGDEVAVDFSSLGKKVSGKIVQIGQYINPQNRTFKIKVDLSEQSTLFKPNLLSIITLTDYKVDNVIAVPTRAIQDDLKGNFLFVNEGGRASKKYVTLGISNEERTEIVDGLDGSETIVTKGHRGLVQGEKLKVE